MIHFTIICLFIHHWTLLSLINMYMQMKCSSWIMHYNLSQVSQGQAGHSISWSQYANRSPLLHRRRFVCVCVCVWFTHAWPPLLHTGRTSPPFWSLPLKAFTGLTEFVHVSPVPACDLLPCYTTWQIDECSYDSLKPSNRRKKTQAWLHTDTHWKILTDSLSLCLQPCCMFE